MRNTQKNDPKDGKNRRNEMRKRVDLLDVELLDILNKRVALVIEMGKIKKKAGMKLYDPGREESVLKRLVEENKGPLDAEAVVRLFERIIDESRHAERVRVYDREG
ncbi:MAG: chorismate mutase [candidate division Zixibacteria bacterium]|nr:chorismate mutase [candidate division Zixibacteria bacterium]